ncbi:type II toxin-antitoxin system VapB family antitoxin [Rhizobium sp. 9140]|uniref:type II toxin-antitoxin system VapB family antitoxin n=1 Tax=Rhizobium sp. 9140 TaxID=1761900 RepID=UPI0007962213|nr:type II toxin-antitoxin system VapB family antitoxin [Rhizobium sp. 9140]CZT37282.1 Rv0623-like transcription factor [Rhizobium sp. 9140]
MLRYGLSSTKNITSEPQLSIRSTKARDLAHALSRRTGQPISRLVELALERYDVELRQQDKKHPLYAVWELATEGRRNVPAGTTSAHDDLYDENGLPI